MSITAPALLDYTILFVEDDDNIRQNYVHVLKEQYANILESNNGSDAYKIYKKNRPDIIITDINMPKVNGIDFIKKVRESDINTKVIVFTSFTDSEILLQAVELKITKYLVKPVGRDVLNLALDQAINEIQNINKTLVLKHGFSWDFYSSELYQGKKLFLLTRKEKEVLNLIFRHTNSICYYSTLQSEIWEEESVKTLDNIKNIIRNIRKKTFDDIVITSYGEGFMPFSK